MNFYIGNFLKKIEQILNNKIGGFKVNEDLVVLYSGGADSTLLLKMAVEMGKKPLALMIDYQQLHIEELEFALKYLEKNKIESMIVNLKGYNVNSA